MGIPCVNCGTDVPPNEAKFFGKIFICPACYKIAERLYQRGEQELKMLLLVLHESIRVAIVQKQLQFSPQQVEDMKKEDLLAHLQKLARDVSASEAQKKEDKSVLRRCLQGPPSR